MMAAYDGCHMHNVWKFIVQCSVVKDMCFSRRVYLVARFGETFRRHAANILPQQPWQTYTQSDTHIDER